MGKFIVLYNGRPADGTLSEDWSPCAFDSFNEAQDYANKWLGAWGPYDFKVDEKYDFSGIGDFISIKKREI